MRIKNLEIDSLAATWLTYTWVNALLVLWTSPIFILALEPPLDISFLKSFTGYCEIQEPEFTTAGV